MELHGSGTQALQVFNLPPCQQPAVEAGRVPAWPLNVVAVDGGLISATGAVHPLVPLSSRTVPTACPRRLSLE